MNIENAILDEVNLCRSHPSSYSSKLEAFLRSNPHLLSSSPVTPSFLSPLFDYLRTLPPLPSLLWSEGLSKAAKSHNESITKLEVKGHIGLDGSDPGIRVARYCEWSGSLCEIIQYCNPDAPSIVSQLLINEENPSQVQHLSFLRPNFNHIGISFDQHRVIGPVCVLLFSETISFEKPEKKPKKKGPVSEYVKIKDMTLTERTEKVPMKKGRGSEYVKIKEITPQEKLAENKDKFKNLIGLTHCEVSELKEFFDNIASGSEVLTSTDLKALWENTKFNESVVFNKIRGFDIDRVESIDFENFVGLIAQNLSEDSSTRMMFSPILSKDTKIEEPLSSFKEIFEGLDYEKSGFDFDSSKVVLCNSEELSQSDRMDFGGYLEKVSESEVSISGVNEALALSVCVEEGAKVYGRNSFYETHSETNKCRVRLQKQVKEVFDLLDGDRTGWIAVGMLTSVLDNPEFKKRFQVFYEVFPGVNESVQKLSYEEFCRLCFKTNTPH